MSLRPVRVLIVDDSAVVRGLLVKALTLASDVEVVGTAMHGELALRQLDKLLVDVVVLDVEMPILDGLATLPRILERFPDVRVIMASAHTAAGAKTTLEALAMGAAACIEKPTSNSVSESVNKLADELLPLVRALAPHRECDGPTGSQHSVPRSTTSPTGYATGKPTVLDPQRLCGTVTRRAVDASFHPAVIVIGSSTGGPNALSQVMRHLGDGVRQPILIAQHMPPTFTPLLAKHLEKDSGRPACEGVSGMPIEEGHIYVAPGEFHMTIERTSRRMVIHLNSDSQEHFCRPSVNPLFRSAARWYGNRVLAVMLTGMGEDGIEGTVDVVRAGGVMLAQDEATSVVWGMPGAVVRADLAHEVLPLGKIASTIERLCCVEVSCL